MRQKSIAILSMSKAKATDSLTIAKCDARVFYGGIISRERDW